MTNRNIAKAGKIFMTGWLEPSGLMVSMMFSVIPHLMIKNIEAAESGCIIKQLVKRLMA